MRCASYSNFTSNYCSGCSVIDLASYGEIVFRGNHLENNLGDEILRLDANAYYYYSPPRVTVDGNIFLDNQVPLSAAGDAAVVTLRSGGESLFRLHGNEFNNPRSALDISTAEFHGGDPEDMLVNATNNLFVLRLNATESAIDDRIYDDDEDSMKPEVLFVPFLPSNYVPQCSSSCSGNGICVFPGYCICEVGWKSEVCDEPTCQRLDFCSSNGDCIDYDLCNCTSGWLGADCSTPDCSAVDDCNSHGTCVAPDLCSCDIGYAGRDCTDCASNFLRVGGRCRECPLCYNGTVSHAVEVSP